MSYRRVIVKLSGRAMAGDRDWGFDPNALNRTADELLHLHAQGIQVGAVVGGGNIFRGKLAETWGIERAEADNIGMLATVLNSLLLRGALQARGEVDVRVMTPFPMNTVAEPFIRLRAIRHLEHGCVVILAGGTGNPYVTTDYAAVQRALELRAEALLAAKDGTDGLYTAEPSEPNARRYRTATYDTVIRLGLQALDQTAVLLARDHQLPIHVFGFDSADAMQRICRGEEMGTLIGAEADVMADDSRRG